MADLYFEGLSDSGESDLFAYDGSGVPVDLTASLPNQGGGIVDGYDNELGALGVDPGPSVAAAGSNVFFSGDDDGLDTLFFYRKSSGKVTALHPANAWGSGVTPQDLTAVGSEVYFVGTNAAGKDTLWKSNGKLAGTKEVAGSPVDIGDMALVGTPVALVGTTLTPLGTTLYFSGGGHLRSYDTATGVFATIAHSAGLDPQDMVNVSGIDYTSEWSNLLMAGTDSAGEQNIFMKQGRNLVEYKSNIYSGAMDPRDLTQVTTGLDGLTESDIGYLYFSGVDNSSGDRGLYFVDPGSPGHMAVDVAASSFGGVSNLDPFDLTAVGAGYVNETYFTAYFTGNDQYSSGRGLFILDSFDNTVTEIIKSNQLDLTDGYVSARGSANQPTLASYDGKLYFGASNPNAVGAESVDQLYSLTPGTTTATLVSVNSLGQTFGGQPANLVSH